MQQNLQKVLEYVFEHDDSAQIVKSASADSMPFGEYLIIDSSNPLGWNYITPLENYLNNNGIGFSFSDEFAIDYDHGKAYYTQDYNMGWNFVLGDGYILGEDEAQNLEPEDILDALDAYNLSGPESNIWELPKNGELFGKLDEGNFGHHLEFKWNDYYDHAVKRFIARHRNWVFIIKCCNYNQVIAIRKRDPVLNI